MSSRNISVKSRVGYPATGQRPSSDSCSSVISRTRPPRVPDCQSATLAIRPYETKSLSPPIDEGVVADHRENLELGECLFSPHAPWAPPSHRKEPAVPRNRLTDMAPEGEALTPNRLAAGFSRGPTTGGDRGGRKETPLRRDV